jgi:hypothetical protein
MLLNFGSSTSLEAKNRNSGIDKLRQEIIDLLGEKNLGFLEKDTQEVEVEFLINARNELVIMDVNGDSVSACEYVKKMLSYKRVKYTEKKQLTPYNIKVKLVKN